jgi:hypothetical protein
MNWNEIRQNAVNLIRSALIGTSIGVLPGIGGAASNLIAYAVARKSSPSPETLGKAQIPTPGKANAMNLNDTANFIGGEWVKSPDTCPNINPSDTGDVINQMPHASLAELEQAIDAAHAATGGWAASTPQQRHDVLDFVGNQLVAGANDIGDLLAREEGKTLPEGIGETLRAAAAAIEADFGPWIQISLRKNLKQA